MKKSNTKNPNSLNERITFRCNNHIKTAVLKNSKKKNISCGKFITLCIEEYLNGNQIDSAETAKCICLLQALITEAISDKALQAKAQERMEELWRALT